MIYLASQSPRRQELLSQINVLFEVVRVEVDETPEPNEAPGALVERLALTKALAGLASVKGQSSHPVLGSDTIVVLDNEVLGKPTDQAHAVSMLSRLSGRTHKVMTAVALVSETQQTVIHQTSQVRFRELSEQEIVYYWNTGEPCDKAGSYGIQGMGAVFVSHLEGSYSGVMGLPLFETAALLQTFGLPCGVHQTTAEAK